MNQAIAILFGMYVLGLFAACLFLWAVVIYSKVLGRDVVPRPQPRPLAPWGLFDIAVGIMVVVACATLFARGWVTVGLPVSSAPATINQQHASTTNVTVGAQASHDERSMDDASSSGSPTFAITQQSSATDAGADAAAASPASGDSTADSSSTKSASDSDSKPSDASNSAASLPFQTWVLTSQLVSMILMTIFISWRCRVAIHRVGWDTKAFGKQLALGGAFAILFVPPIYILMAIVTALSKQEYSHPIIEMMRENPSMLWLAVWSAVIVAPITEEFAFRVVIQGYLDSMAAGSFGSADVILGRQSYWPVLSLSHQISVPPVDNDGLLENPADILAQQDRVNLESSASTVQNSNPYSPPRDDSLQARLDARSVTNDKPVNMASLPIWPILVSGTLFGLLHYSYGVSWIPLIALGIVLGWLYRITGTIWPSLLVHMVVNGTSMWGLVSQILMGDKGS